MSVMEAGYGHFAVWYRGAYPATTVADAAAAWQQQDVEQRQGWAVLQAESEQVEQQHAEQMKGWPVCPNGCGCRMNTEDAEVKDCACAGPCVMECQENGYPDVPSYRYLIDLQ